MTSTLQTLESLLDGTEDVLLDPNCELHYTEDNLTLTTQHIVFMDTKDISTITAVSSPQIPSSPTAFLGHTLQEIQDWFDENITQPYTEGSMYLPGCFVVLDDRTVEDDTCIFVYTDDSGEIQSLRCTFDVVMWNIICCDLGESVDDPMGEFFAWQGDFSNW